MKKILLILLSLYSFYILSMENGDESDSKIENKQEREVGNNLELLHLLGYQVPNELRTKILGDAFIRAVNEKNELFNQVQQVIADNNINKKTWSSKRHLNDVAFQSIGQIIQKFAPFTYANLALFITLTDIFSPFEKAHFLSLMITQKDLTQKQSKILEFLAEQAYACIPTAHYGSAFKKGIITSEALIQILLSNVYEKYNIDEIDIILRYFLKQGIKLSSNSITYLVRITDKKMIPLIYLALKRGANLNELIPNFNISTIEYCKKMHEAWHDYEWLHGPEDPKYCYSFKMGEGYINGFNNENVPNEETINCAREYYKTLLAICDEHISKNQNRYINEADHQNTK